MNIRQIDYVLAVFELQSFGKAADKCFISQSTLSTMIGRFEDEIGITIFDRKTKPVSISKEGVAIIRQLKVVRKELEILEELTQTIKGELSGELKIGIIPTVAPFVLPKFLSNFSQKFPQLKISVSEITTHLITDLLLKRELDIGILAVPLKNETLVEIPLYNEPFVLYDCSVNSTRKTIDVSQINYDKFWLIEESHCLHTQVNTICDFDICSHKNTFNFDFKAGSIDSLIRFVKINQGITMLPYLASLDFSKKEAAKIIQFNEPVPVRSIGLVVHKHFVKKEILSLLKAEIQAAILPLLNLKEEELVIEPV